SRRFVFTRHHSDHNIRLGKHWHTRIDAVCARHADAVIAVSEATRTIMVNDKHVPPERITVVLNGYERLPDPDPVQVRKVRTDLAVVSRGCAKPRRIVRFCGARGDEPRPPGRRNQSRWHPGGSARWRDRDSR